MREIYLATFVSMPDGEPGGGALLTAFEERGAKARWVIWDDPSVDWSAADAVAVRATWDYDQRLPEFLTWVDSVGPTLLNGADLFRWNTDKVYLVDLAAGGLPVVPSISVEDRDELPAAVAATGTAVVKPRVSAGGRGLVVVREPADLERVGDDGPWLVQPLVESIHDTGEISVFVMGGRAVTQVRKVAGADDVRVHEHHGGVSIPVPLDPTAAGLAQAAFAAAEQATGADIVYARIDLLDIDGTLRVSEIEVTEPGLYLDLVPENASHFAAAVMDSLS